jgi:tellurite resistance protein TerC
MSTRLGGVERVEETSGRHARFLPEEHASMDVSLTMWVTTVVVLVVLIAVDFFVGARKPHEVSLGEAGIWSAVWIVLAGLFAGFLWWHSGSASAGQFLAGWITEKSLSVDNLFVFVLIMAKFAVPRVYQQRVLMIGVLVALLLRTVFIAAGAAVIDSFSWVFFLFGAFLIWTAWKLIKEARSGEEDGDFEESRLLRAVERRFPTTDGYRGTRLTVVEGGRRLITPMLLVILAIGTTDVLFAMDSIPAIFGLTQDAYIVFAANAFALMGLRQLYFLIGGLLNRLVHLSYGLSVILGFIGVKLLLHALHEAGLHGAPEIGTPLSLTVVIGVLAVTTVTSLISVRGTARGQRAEELSREGER